MMRVIGWGKPLSYDEPPPFVEAFHAVKDESHSIVTVCGGRWSSESPYVLYLSGPALPRFFPSVKWCPACDDEVTWDLKLRSAKLDDMLERATREGIELLQHAVVV